MTRHTLMPLWATIRGGKSWIEKNALLYDTFATADAAPITSPRTCEPGPGTLTAVENDGSFGIVSGVLDVTGQTTAALGDLYILGGNQTKANGLSVFAKITVDDTTGQIYPGFGFYNDATPDAEADQLYGLHFTNAAIRLKQNQNNAFINATISAATEQLHGVVIRPVGAFHIMDGEIVGLTDVAATTDAGWYPGVHCWDNSFTMDDLMVLPLATYDSSWGGDWTEVTDTKTNPASATTFNCNADFHLNFTFTVEDGTSVTINFRYTDSNNRIYAEVSTSRTFRIKKATGGSYSTLYNGATLSDATSYNYDIVGYGSSIKVYQDKVLVSSLTETDHQTVSAGNVSHTLASNDIVITTNPHPSLGIADSRVICPQDENTFTHSADFVAEIKGVVLPAANNLSHQFRISGSDELTLNIASDGSLALLDNATSRISAAGGTVSADDTVVLVCDGANGQVFVNGTSAGTTSAIAHLTGTSGKRDDSTSGAADHIALFPRDVSSLLPEGTY